MQTTNKQQARSKKAGLCPAFFSLFFACTWQMSFDPSFKEFSSAILKVIHLNYLLNAVIGSRP